MAKKTGLQKWQALAKRYEKATGKKATGMKTEQLELFFKKQRKKKRKSSSKSTRRGSGAMNLFRNEGW